MGDSGDGWVVGRGAGSRYLRDARPWYPARQSVQPSRLFSFAVFPDGPDPYVRSVGLVRMIYSRMENVMRITASKLRENVYRILDEVVETGVPVEVVRKGAVVRIVAEKPVSKLARLKKRKVFIGD